MEGLLLPVLALSTSAALSDGILLAQDAEDTGGNLIGFLLPLLILGGLFYALFVLPQRRRMRQMDQLRSSIQIGDEVRTVGGIYGIVTGIDDDTMMIDVGGGVTLRIANRAVADRVGGPDRETDTE